MMEKQTAVFNAHPL